MVKKNRILIFAAGFICAWILFSGSTERVQCQPALPSNITFSGESNVIYFLDRDSATLYRYNMQGRLTRTYIIKELGENLQFK